MNQSNKLAKIRWACRRGMLELDFILNEFIAHGFLNLSDTEQDELLYYLENADPDLYSWLMGYKKPESEADIKMTNIIRDSQQI